MRIRRINITIPNIICLSLCELASPIVLYSVCGAGGRICVVHGMTIVRMRAITMGCYPTGGFRESVAVPIAALRTERQPEIGNEPRAFENGSHPGRFCVRLRGLAAPEGRQTR